MVHETGRGWPGYRSGLQRDKTCEVETVHVGGVAVRGDGVWLSQDGHKHPLRSDYHGEADIRSRLKVEELATTHEKLYDLPRDFVGVAISTTISILGGASEVIRCQLAETVVKAEFWDHQETLLNGHFFLLLSLVEGLTGRSRDLLSLLLPQQ